MHLGSPYCSYGDVVETKLHVLRDCPLCMTVWLTIVQDNKRELFFNANLQQWVTLNINGTIVGNEIDNWDAYWASACHIFWYWRNQESHDDNFVRSADPIRYIMMRVNEYTGTTKINRVVQARSNTSRHIRWVASLHDWVVINSDAAMTSTFKLGCGGILCDHRGE
ncbi:RNA-directed DNA polymerase (Reverse transcriptase) [Trifolium medium]|uniref:RNA-directed DNA polymerase (Reverse transcriptase) n=1 Tax=Trifolium medium TaxID=97028 RepID=A0A392Q5Q8_9FABA|nr:RNA-directed DNA polymerase (Reverse transcriptase) [Trifolium medium]